MSGEDHQVPPQVQVLVALGSQYAVLAKWVKGVNALTCVSVNAVILCRLESSTGLALTAIAAKRAAKKVHENMAPGKPGK